MEKLTSPLKQFAHFLIPWFLLALFFGQYGKHFLHSPFLQIGLCHKMRLKNWKTGNNLTQRHSGFFKNAFNRKVYFVTCMYFELALFLAECSCTLMPYGQCPPPRVCSHYPRLSISVTTSWQGSWQWHVAPLRHPCSPADNSAPGIIVVTSGHLELSGDLHIVTMDQLIGKWGDLL